MNIVNQTIRDAKLPLSIKLSERAPIFKTSDVLDTDNYRPVNVLPCLSKIVERIFYEQLYAFLTISYQHSSQLSEKCTAATTCSWHGKSQVKTFLNSVKLHNYHGDIYACHSWKQWNALPADAKDIEGLNVLKNYIDKDVGIILMDLSKAFDCIPHGLLLTKLKCHDISDQACLLLKSYISDRKQRIKVGHSRSEWGSVAQGVPQGSILGPLIFNIFINDIFYVLENVCNLYNYAGDDTLLNTHRSITCLKTKLETSAAVAMHWFDVNGMK